MVGVRIMQGSYILSNIIMKPQMRKTEMSYSSHFDNVEIMTTSVKWAIEFPKLHNGLEK